MAYESDYINLEVHTNFPPREEAPTDKEYIKHVICEGAHFHVLSYSTQGTHCSEPKCIINKR